MPGQHHIWHIKVRRIGRVDYEETQFKHRSAPVQGEFIAMKGMGISAKIVAFNESVSGSTATYEILSVPDNGNPRGHGEFEQ
jgi:hypothetical protein